MSESDTDFEMLEKRLSDLNPDELILVMNKTVSHLCTALMPLLSNYALCFRLPVLFLRCSTCTTCPRISAMHRVKELPAWERYDYASELSLVSNDTMYFLARMSIPCAGGDVYQIN